jgi:hypothetical protein
MEQVLGIQPTGAGFSTVNIRPDLVDLSWARGAEPTPKGLLKVSARKDANGLMVSIDLPDGVAARVSVPATSAVTVNGSSEPAERVEGGTRMLVTLNHPGHFDVAGQ